MQPCKTGDQTYSDASPYSECSLPRTNERAPCRASYCVRRACRLAECDARQKQKLPSASRDRKKDDSTLVRFKGLWNLGEKLFGNRSNYSVTRLWKSGHIF